MENVINVGSSYYFVSSSPAILRESTVCSVRDKKRIRQVIWLNQILHFTRNGNWNLWKDHL